MREIWKKIEEYPNYLVSNMGRVCGPRGKILQTQPNCKTGYYQAMLYNESGYHLKSVHRLVAEAFIPRLEPEKCLVRHKDGQLWNNKADNLIWAYYSDKRNKEAGIEYAAKQKVEKKTKRYEHRHIVKQLSTEGAVIGSFVGFDELEKMGFKKYGILGASRGKSFKGYFYKNYRWAVEAHKIEIKEEA